jgi:hypothetical protein
MIIFSPPLISEGSLEKCFQNPVLYFHQDDGLLVGYPKATSKTYN